MVFQIKDFLLALRALDRQLFVNLVSVSHNVHPQWRFEIAKHARKRFHGMNSVSVSIDVGKHLLHTVHRSFSFEAVWWTFFTCKFLSHVVENSLLGHSGQGWILGAWRRLMWPSKSFTFLWQSGHWVFSAWSILKCRSNFCCPGKYWLQCWN